MVMPALVAGIHVLKNVRI